MHQHLAATRIVTLIAALMAVLWAGGCDDIALQGETRTLQPRPAGRPVGRSTQPPHSPPIAPAANQAPPTTRTAASPVAPSKVVPSEQHTTFYQLVLLSQPAPAEAPPGMTFVHLEHTTARQAGETLALLYLPAGPSGTDSRYTLVYPSEREVVWASKAAQLLDDPGQEADTASPDVTTAWRTHIAAFREIATQFTPPQDQLHTLVEHLGRCAVSSGLDSQRRWIAGMLAGTLALDRLYEFDRAKLWLDAAEAAAEPGSYEQMATLHAQARVALQAGKRDVAHGVLERILAEFTALRDTEVFNRARRAWVDLDER